MKNILKSILPLGFIFIGVSALFYSTPTHNETINSSETITLSKCTDGDTAHFMINDKDTVVRFLAIDTPETKHPTKGKEPFGQEASDYTCTALSSANEITLEYDPNADQDKYGRVLAWIHVDGNLLQEELVSNGLAKVEYLYGDYKYTDILMKAQEQAKKQKLGIWE